MAFDLETWRTKARERLDALPAGGAEDRARVVAECLWPVVEAVRAGENSAVAVLQEAGGEGRCAGILERMGRWGDVSVAARDLGAALPAEVALAAEIAAVMRYLDVAPGSYLASNIGSGGIGQGPGAIGAGAGSTVNQTNYYFQSPDPEARKAAEAERRYLERLRVRCNVLSLAALGGAEGTQVEVSLDQVYVEQVTRTPAKDDGSSQRPAARGRQRFLTALEAVTGSERTVLLGDPGGGKSTFVRQLAGWLASARLREKEPPPPYPSLHNAGPEEASTLAGGQTVQLGWDDRPLPLLLELREVSPALQALSLERLSYEKRRQSLVQAIRDRWRAMLEDFQATAMVERMTDALDRGDAVLFLEGLDEVPPSARDRVCETVAALAEACPRARRCVMTCRSRSYSDGSELAGFVAHTLAPFDDEMIARFAAAWYEAQHRLGRFAKEQAAARADDFRKAALSKSLKELSQNPMLLTAMAIVHQRDTRLPDQRVQLYQKVVEILQFRWQEHKDPNLPVSAALDAVLQDRVKVRGLLQRIAYFVHDREARGTDDAAIPRQELMGMLEASDFLGEAGLASQFLDYVDQRAGVMVGQGGDGSARRPHAYAFPHRTIQEFLAGCQMVSDRGAAREYLRRAKEGDFWQVAALLGAEHLLHNGTGNPELLLELAYALCPVAQPTDNAPWRALLWSGHMAAALGTDTVRSDAEWPDGGVVYLECLARRLLQAMRGALPVGLRVEAGRVLAKVGDPRPEVMDPMQIDFCTVPAGRFLMGSDENDWEADTDERPQQSYDIPYDYQISRHPITQAQFRLFVAAGGYREARYWRGAEQAGVWHHGRVRDLAENPWRDSPYDYGEPFRLDNHPVVGVTWYEARAFALWLSERRVAAGQSPVHLPSEPEWEKAARGGDGRRYPWGSDFDLNRAHSLESRIFTTSAVGCFPGGRGRYEVEDMAGNVWEWTRSLYEPYTYPSRLEAGSREHMSAGAYKRRVLRGGSCYGNHADVRCSARSGYLPHFQLDRFGFRVVTSPFSPPD